MSDLVFRRFVRTLANKFRALPRRYIYLAGGTLVGAFGLTSLLVVRSLMAPTSVSMSLQLTTRTLAYGSLAVSALAILAAFGFALGRTSDELMSLAERDPLTAFFNRGYFDRRLSREIHRHRRYGSAMSILTLNLDDLRLVNDAQGYGAGDSALLAVAQSISQSVRAEDIVARIGGDEFAIIMPHTTASEAATLAVRIEASLIGRMGAWVRPLSASIGITDLIDMPKATFEDVLQAADIALHRAKAGGGGYGVIAQHNGGIAEPFLLVRNGEVNVDQWENDGGN